MGMFRNLMIASGTRRRDPLYGIHYVADWDGKDRSNEEDEPMRSTWTDRATGKVIDLHNFAFAGMSGWGGYGIDCSKVVVNGPQDMVEGNVLQFNAIANSANFLYGVSGMESVSAKIKVDGISRAVASGIANYLQIYFSSSDGERLRITDDGVHDVEFAVPEGTQWMYLYVARAISAPDWTPIDPVTVEILPSYPGALVGDGIDDYGVTQEAINEEVGTMLIMAYLISRPNDGTWASFVNTLVQTVPGWISATISSSSQNLFVNKGFSPSSVPNIFDRIFISGHSRESASPGTSLYICTAASNVSFANVAIYRLILIKEQLNETQIAYLVNKVQKEYNDWCRANGYDYAIING